MPGCEKCGEPHAGCTGHVKIRDENEQVIGLRACLNPSLRGLAVCRMHGGGAPAVKAAGIRRWEEERAEKRALRTLNEVGVTEVVDPISELIRVASETLAFKDAIADRLGLLTEDQWRYQSEKGAEQLRAEVSLYERALDRTSKLLIDLEKLGLEERKVRLSEIQKSQVAEAWKRFSNSVTQAYRKELAQVPGASERLAIVEAQLPSLTKDALLSTEAA